MRVLLRSALVLTLLFTLGLTAAPARAAAWTPRPATYEVMTEKDVRIPMSDGSWLVADILRPARDGKPAPGRFPVLVTQTPYNKNVPTQNFAIPYLVERGYVQVIADVRGTGGSPGQWLVFGKREQRDGYELVRWAASHRRPWSNGRVGTYGISYAAINQLFTAAQRPPGLRATFPLLASGDVYRDLITAGGQPNLAFTPAYLGLVTALGLIPATYGADDPQAAFETWAGHLESALTKTQLPALTGGVSGGEFAYDGPWWRERSAIEVIDKIKAPTFLVGGWYDVYQRSEPMLFQRLQRNGVPTRLVMGPWEHIAASDGGDLPQPGVAAMNDMALRWFDRYVRGENDRALDRDIAPMTYFDLGERRWRTARSWLGPDVTAQALHLDGPARPGIPGKLATDLARKTHNDPISPIPVAGLCSRSTSQFSAGVNELIAASPCDQHTVNDLTGIAYDYPVAKQLRLFGPVAARLFLGSTAGDGQIIARLEDVAPDGTVTQLTSGTQVLSLRALDNSRTVRRDGKVLLPYHPLTKDSAQPVPAGQVVEVYIEIFPTAATIAPGHTLRLALQTGDFPHLVAPTNRLAATAANVVTVHHTGRHPSQLILPIGP